MGWFEAGATEAFDFDTPITDNLTLYAKWGEIIVGWDFENTNTTTARTASHGIAANAAMLVEAVGAGGYTTPTGTTTGTYSISTTGWEVEVGVDTKYWIAPFSTVGYKNITLISSYQMSSNTGPRDFKLQYSFDATDWVDVDGGSITVTNNWTGGVLADLPLPAELENQAIVLLRWVVTSTTSANGSMIGRTGTSRLDEVYIGGYPIN